jgi:hypothetical protein
MVIIVGISAYVTDYNKNASLSWPDTRLYKQFESPLEINEFELLILGYYLISKIECNLGKMLLMMGHDRTKAVP